MRLISRVLFARREQYNEITDHQKKHRNKNWKTSEFRHLVFIRKKYAVVCRYYL